MVSFQTIKNAICRVNFAGFVSDTLQLQNNGWQLSMEQLADRNSIRLAMRHEAARIHALSSEVSYEAMFYMRPGFNQAPPLEFHIVHMFHNGMLHIPLGRRPSFKAIDAVPQFDTMEQISFADAVPFRAINTDAPEIVLAQQSVPELMELILKLQDPRQKEIRENRRKDAWRNGGEGMRLSEGYSPSADIRAQIITLAS